MFIQVPVGSTSFLSNYTSVRVVHLRVFLNFTTETPFKLTYGTEAVIPVKVGVASIKQEVLCKEDNDDQLWINLDCLDEVRDKDSSRMTIYQ